MEKVTIRFTNGETIEAEVNGNNFITDTEPEFPDDLTKVEIESEEGTTVLNDVFVQEGAPLDGRYWFILMETPKEEIKTNELEAQVFYTAVMTDTLMEE